jgi:hypothetical protein
LCCIGVNIRNAYNNILTRFKNNQMETNQTKSHLKNVVQQVTHNAISWIGHGRGQTKNHISGQTFTCPITGKLDCIQIFSDFVANNGAVDLTMHAFNAEARNWGPALGTSSVEFNKSDAGKWISFSLNGLNLTGGKVYGFKITSDDGLIGVGEAAGSVNQIPCAGGQEWVADSDDQSGSYYTYFSLAFKVALRA